MDNINPALPEVLHKSDGTEKEKLLLSRKLVIGEGKDPYCRKFFNTTKRPGSV